MSEWKEIEVGDVKKIQVGDTIVTKSGLVEVLRYKIGPDPAVMLALLQETIAGKSKGATRTKIQMPKGLSLWTRQI